jgi:hypothetical protein
MITITKLKMALKWGLKMEYELEEVERDYSNSKEK